MLSSLIFVRKATLETTVINYPQKNRINPYKKTTFTPYADKLNNVVVITEKYKKDGSPKIKRRYSPYDVAVYGDLMRRTRGRKNASVFPKIQTIADKLDFSYGTVQRALCKFENDLVIYRKHTGRASEYFFVPLKSDGTPDENSGDYHFAKAILDRKKGKSDLAEKNISYNDKETKKSERLFLSLSEEQRATKKAELISLVPKGLKISMATIYLWINVALKYFSDDAEGVFYRAFNDKNPAAYFWKVYKSKISDTKKRQSQTKKTSDKTPPPNPQKEQSFQEDIISLQAKEESYRNHISSLSDFEKINLIEKIIPQLNSFTINRLKLNHGINPDIIDVYFSNGVVRTTIMGDLI